MSPDQIVDFNSLSEEAKAVIREAVSIREKAYCPYSNFSVGAAILCEDTGRIYSGANVENAALSPSICAERSAVPKAVNDGCRKFKMVAVAAHQESSWTAPCGVCRQTLREFPSSSGDTEVFLCKPSMDRVLRTTLGRLLPLAFVSYTRDSVP